MTLSPASVVAWEALVDDRDAIWGATVAAAKAYRALVGAIPSQDSVDPDPADGVLGPLVAVLTLWAGGRRGAVDLSRARRLFWVHWLGTELFEASFPGEAPSRPTDLARGQGAAPEGVWSTARRATQPHRAGPIDTLCAPWPADITVLLLAHLGLVDTLAPQSAGGRVICADPPFATDN